MLAKEEVGSEQEFIFRGHSQQTNAGILWGEAGAPPRASPFHKPLQRRPRSSHLRRVPLALAPQFLENSLTLIAAASGPGAGGFMLGNKPPDGKGRDICVINSALSIPAERSCCILVIYVAIHSSCLSLTQ